MSRTTIARREFSALTREKTIILALVIQLLIAGFSAFLVVGLTSLYDPGAVSGEGIDVGIAGETRDTLRSVAEDNDDVSAVEYDTPAGALTGFENGAVDAVVVGTPMQDGDGTRISVRAVAPAEDLRTTLIVVSLREYLADVEDAERTARAANLGFSPVEPPAEGQNSDFFGFTYTILLPLLLFLPAFLSGSIAVDSITEELERGTLDLLRVAPVSLVAIVDGKAAAMAVLAPLQALLWIGLLQLNGFGVENVLALVVFVAAIATLTVSLGVSLALLTGTRRRAQLLYSVLALALFGLSVVAPEHPASTIALLAVDSATAVTFGHVAATVGLAVVAILGVRRWVRSLDDTSL